MELELDNDVKKILELADAMKDIFKALEARQRLTVGQKDAIAGAADNFRWFRVTCLSHLRAEFDLEYKKWIRDLTKRIKGGPCRARADMDKES